MRFLVIGILLLLTTGVQAASGVLSVKSHHGVDQTMQRLTTIVEEKGFRVFADIDHAAAAKKVDLVLRPTRLLIFGKPKAGTLLMQSAQTVAIDLPLKYLVWEDAAGNVLISWNAPGYLADRHELHDSPKVISKIAGALRKIAEAAAGS